LKKGHLPQLGHQGGAYSSGLKEKAMGMGKALLLAVAWSALQFRAFRISLA